jgi:hypothetical protein
MREIRLLAYVSICVIVSAGLFAAVACTNTDGDGGLAGEDVSERSERAGDEYVDLPFMKGVYGDPGQLLEEGYAFDELGMNAIFVRSVQFDHELYEAARGQGMRIFVEFPTLLGRDYVDENPDAWPIDQTGEESPPADWFMGVCPTSPEFIDYREDQLRDILDQYNVDGIFLDYVHWHAQFETNDPILPETCFCDRCIELFSDMRDLNVPEGETSDRAEWILSNADSQWRDWRNTILNGWVSNLTAIVREIQPDAVVGIFYASWFPEEHEGALYRTLGIDVEAFAEKADVLSPMLFHKLKNQEPSWVSQYIHWLDNLIDESVTNRPLIWPIVQAHNSPDRVTPDEFRQVMLEGTVSPVSGIMMFSDQALLEDPEKIEVMQELYQNEIGM